MNTTTKPNTFFWIIGILALLWNIIGVYLWLYEYFLMTQEMRAALPPEQVEIMANAPSWSMYVYAIAVISGLLASVLLLLRKKPGSGCIYALLTRRTCATVVLDLRNGHSGKNGATVLDYATYRYYHRNI
jgi:hypothetical protein